ncbi:MAG: hypothetical protein FWE39_17700 [Nocardiaceae bacterium]|nr:hypothetical protein [Nocardiaceae bacterium]
MGQLVLEEQEQQLEVEQEQQLEQEQLELDQASSTDSSVISSTSNVALSRALSSFFSSGMAILSLLGMCWGDATRNGCSENRGAPQGRRGPANWPVTSQRAGSCR